MGELSDPQDHVIAVAALIRKRAGVLFEITESEKRADALRVQLVHIDAVLRMFRPGLQPDGLPARHRRPTKSVYFKHGDLNRRIFDTLRVQGTVNSAELAVAAMRDKGLDPDHDQPTRSDFVRRFGLQLGDLRRKGKLEKMGAGNTLRWKLVTA